MKTQLVAPDVEFSAVVNDTQMTICYDYYEQWDELSSEWVRYVEIVRAYNDEEEFDLDSPTFYDTCELLARENLDQFIDEYYDDGDYDE